MWLQGGWSSGKVRESEGGERSEYGGGRVIEVANQGSEHVWYQALER